MTLYLLALRQAIVVGTFFMLAPVEIAFDLIEAELNRRGVEP